MPLGKEGALFDPKLTEISKKLPENLYNNAILHPVTSISFGYEGHTLQMKDGSKMAGIIASQTEDKLNMHLSGSKVMRYATKYIAARQPLANSLRSANLLQSITEQEWVNLVEYLASFK